MSTDNQTSAISLRVKPDQLAFIEAVARECSMEAIANDGHFIRAMRMAAGIRALKEAITGPILQELMSLQGSALGFRTDKDRDGGYAAEIVKDFAIAATLRGAYWVGNEFNIIAGREYMTKEFFTRKLREFPGLTDLRLSPGAPVMREQEGRAYIAYKASWVLNGKPDYIEKSVYKIADSDKMIDERIVVKLNKGMGEDAALGKAERKIRAAIYARITGSEMSDADVDDPQAVIRGKAVNTLEELAERIEGPQNGNGSGSTNGSGAAESTDRPSTGTDPDPLLIDAARQAFAAAYEEGRLALVTKAEEEFRTKAHDEATRTAISGMADETRQRIRSSPSFQSKQAKQKELAST